MNLRRLQGKVGSVKHVKGVQYELEILVLSKKYKTCATQDEIDFLLLNAGESDYRNLVGLNVVIFNYGRIGIVPRNCKVTLHIGMINLETGKRDGRVDKFMKDKRIGFALVDRQESLSFLIENDEVNIDTIIYQKNGKCVKTPSWAKFVWRFYSMSPSGEQKRIMVSTISIA